MGELDEKAFENACKQRKAEKSGLDQVARKGL